MVSYGSMRAHFPLMPKRIRFGAQAAKYQIIHLALKITRNRGERLEVGDKYIWYANATSKWTSGNQRSVDHHQKSGDQLVIMDGSAAL